MLPGTQDKWLPFVAGATGGACATIVTCPLEVIKTRLQTHNSRQVICQEFQVRNPTVRHVLTSILRSEGLPGFWRGITPSLAGVIPARATFFGSYAIFKRTATKYGHSGTLTNFLCASTAGCIVATVTSPIWVLKTRLQLLPVQIATAPYFSLRQLGFDIYKQEGIGAFYKGLSASYWGVTEGAIQLALYEEFKQRYPDPSRLQLFGMAATAKFCAAALTYPHEVVRTRLRDQRTSPRIYVGMIQSIRLIFAQERFRGLYGGMFPHLARVVPNAAIMYFVVEQITG